MMQQGFSLIEMLLSVVLIGLITGLSVPIFFSLKSRSDLDTTGYRIVETIRRAQSYARHGRDDSAWSIHVEDSAVTLYRGLSFASRPVEEDEEAALEGVGASGLSDVSFAKLTGIPNNVGSVTIVGANNETKVITLNAKGMVQF